MNRKRWRRSSSTLTRWTALAHYLVMACAHCFCDFQAKAETPSPALDENRLSQIYQLVVRIPPDVVMVLTPAQEEAKKKYEAERDRKRKEAILQIPDLKPYLFELIDRAYARGDDGLWSFLQALSLRPDLTDADVDRVEARDRQIVAEWEKNVRRFSQWDYISGSLQVLATHPSSAREDLIIHIMEIRYVEDFDTIFGGAGALQKFGTSKSLPILEKRAAFMKKWAVDSQNAVAGQEDKGSWVKPLIDAIESIKAREGGAQKAQSGEKEK